METLIGQVEGPGEGGGDVIADGSTETFQAQVLDASQETPIIVDFWAPWCGPCKTLTPALEGAVKAAGGKVKLVKINVDDNQQLAAQLRIQSIPTVYAFFGGRPVDGFQGAVPESQVKEFVSKLSNMAGQDEKGMIDQAFAQAEEALANGNAQDAAGIFSQLIQHDPQLGAAYAGLARALIAAGQTEQAQEVLNQVPEGVTDPALDAVHRQIELDAETADAAGALPDLEAKVAANPDDHQARIDLAMAYYAAGRHEDAVDQLLESIKRDRDWNEAAARTKLLELFEAWGPTHEATLKGRRRLSSLLFS
jgi:putative thioredoxin